jgi:ATP-dependent Zn protease
MLRLIKIILLWVIIVLGLLVVISRYLPVGQPAMPAVGQPAEINYSAFLDDVKANRVDSVILQGHMIFGTLKDKQQFETHRPETDYSALMSTLQKAGVSTERLPPKQRNFFPRLLLLLLAPLLLILVFVRRSADP